MLEGDSSAHSIPRAVCHVSRAGFSIVWALCGLVLGEGGGALLCISGMCSAPFLEHRNMRVLTATRRPGTGRAAKQEPVGSACTAPRV